MQIQSISNASLNQTNTKQNVNFGATPIAMSRKLKETPLCKGELAIAQKITNFVNGLQSQLNQKGIKTPFEYKLGKSNVIPKEIGEIKVDGKSFNEFDKRISEPTFVCPMDDYKEKKGAPSVADIAKNIFEEMGLDKPHLIEFNKG